MTEAGNNIYQLDIPLKGSPLREVHTYFIKGNDGEKNLLIDTAFNTAECEQALLSQMAELGASPEDTDVFITHMHVDHSGLAGRLKRESNRIYAGVGDAELIHRFQKPEHWAWLTKSNEWCGVPKEHALVPEEHVAFHKRPAAAVALHVLAEGERISYGGYEFQVIDLSGHTPGQIGLWEETYGILFCGDHILERISPNITAWDLEHDYVTIFCDNLKKVKRLRVSQLFSAHGPMIRDISGRIDQLIDHHSERLDQIEQLVRESLQNVSAFEIACRISWSSGKCFETLPIQQKWFACSETLAHLQALMMAKRVFCSSNQQGCLLWRVTP